MSMSPRLLRPKSAGGNPPLSAENGQPIAAENGSQLAKD